MWKRREEPSEKPPEPEGDPQPTKRLSVPISLASWQRATIAAIESDLSLRDYVDAVLADAVPIARRSRQPSFNRDVETPHGHNT